MKQKLIDEIILNGKAKTNRFVYELRSDGIWKRAVDSDKWVFARRWI